MFKKELLLYFVAVCLCLGWVLTACGSEKNISASVNVDYQSAEEFEAALNAGEDLTGKTVSFLVKGVRPDSALGHNLWAGEHLNFVSNADPGIEAEETITVKVTKVSSMLNSWVINYELVQLSSSLTKPLSTKQVSTTTTTNTPETLTTTAAAPVYQNLKIGEVAKDKHTSMGVSFVASSIDLSEGNQFVSDSITDEQEVIYLFMDIRNDSDKTSSYSSREISVYADVTQATSTYINRSIDGYLDRVGSYPLEPGMHAVMLKAFIVEKGWNSLKIFYKDFSWEVYPGDLSKTVEGNKRLFQIDNTLDLTAEGSEVYSKEYSIFYDGVTIYKAEYQGKFAVFEFTVNNTSSKTLDYALIGHEMRAYIDCELLDESSYLLDDIIDDHINIYKVDEIKPGMSAKVYVAFRTVKDTGIFSCVYDVGFGGKYEILATVNVEKK